MNNKRFIERTPKKDLEIDNCDECGKEYLPKVWWQKHCENSCRLLAYRKRNPRISPALLKDIESMDERIKALEDGN